MTNPPPPGTPSYATAAAATGAPVAGNPAGRIATIFAIVSVAFGLVQQMVSVLFPYILNSSNLPYQAIGTIFSVLTIVHVLIGAGALAFGWYGATRRGLPHLTSGIGLGIGAASVISGLFGLVSAPLAGFLI